MTKVLPSDEGYPSIGGDGANSTVVAGEEGIGQDKAKDDHLDSDNSLAKKPHPEPSDTNFGEDNNRRQETMKNEKFDPDPSKEDILLEEKMLASRGYLRTPGRGVRILREHSSSLNTTGQPHQNMRNVYPRIMEASIQDQKNLVIPPWNSMLTTKNHPSRRGPRFRSEVEPID